MVEAIDLLRKLEAYEERLLGRRDLFSAEEYQLRLNVARRALS